MTLHWCYGLQHQVLAAVELVWEQSQLGFAAATALQAFGSS